MSDKKLELGSCAAIIGSVTYAIKAQKLLEVNAIPCSVAKISGKSGCAYGVYFPCIQKNNVETIFQKSNVRVREYL